GLAVDAADLVQVARRVPDETPPVAVSALDLADHETEDLLGVAQRAGGNQLALPQIGRRREAGPARNDHRVLRGARLRVVGDESVVVDDEVEGADAGGGEAGAPVGYGAER